MSAALEVAEVAEVLPPDHPASAIEPASTVMPQQIVGLPAMGEIHTMEAVAMRIAATEMVPRAYRNKPDAILACFLAGRELRVPPMQALRDIDIVEGTPAPSAKLVRELILRAGHSIRRVTTVADEEKATYKYRRKEWPEGEWETATYTIAMAVKAGLVQIKDGKPFARSQKGNPLPWEQYTAAMLRHRCLTLIGREEFPDCLGTMIYTAEELGAVVDAEGRLAEDPRTEAHVRWDAARDQLPDVTRDWLDAKFHTDAGGTLFAYLRPDDQEGWAAYAENTLRVVQERLAGVEEEQAAAEPTPPSDGPAAEPEPAPAEQAGPKKPAAEKPPKDLPTARAQVIAQRCTAAGIKDRGARLALAGMVVGRDLSSTKEVKAHEFDRVMSVLRTIENGGITFAQSGDGEWLLWDIDGQPTTVDEVLA